MLFTALTQVTENPEWAVVTMATFFLSIVVAITIHEFSHAWTAYLLGDHTAQSQGRLTLNRCTPRPSWDGSNNYHRFWLG